MKIIQHLVGGNWIEGRGHVQTLSPRDLTPCASTPVGDSDDVDRAARAASEAFSSWSKLSVEDRCHHVRRLIDVLRSAYGAAGEATAMKQCIVQEIGKPLAEADIELLECAEFTDYFVRISSEALNEKQIEIDSALWPSKKSSVLREPLGVVAIIKPWNYPIEMIMWALAPAILAGNTVVVKPSEKASASAFMLAELIQLAALPNGVVNFVFGDRTTGHALIHTAEVRMISFTGSVAAGRQVAVDASKKFKKVALELGGNDAAIVCPDADLDLVANGLVWGAFCNAGQVCVGIKRAYVHQAIYQPLKRLIVEKTALLRRGIDYGPIIDSAQHTVFRNFISDAIKKGNNILIGGANEDEGYYVRPTVIEVINEKTDLLGAECFGPLLPLIEVQSVDNAIHAANRTEYGLGASVWTKSLDTGRDIARQLNVGMVWINDVNIAFPEAPWGGTKDSGIGFELSPQVFSEYTYPKHISAEIGTEITRAWWYPY